MNTYKLSKMQYGNDTHINSKNHNNYNLITQYIISIFKKTMNNHFIIKYNNSIDNIFNDYEIIPITKEKWPFEYNKDISVAYIKIEQINNIIYVFGRIKSAHSYCTLNQIIKT